MANPTSYLDLLRDDNIDLLLAEGNSFDGHRDLGDAEEFIPTGHVNGLLSQPLYDEQTAHLLPSATPNTINADSNLHYHGWDEDDDGDDDGENYEDGDGEEDADFDDLQKDNNEGNQYFQKAATSLATEHGLFDKDEDDMRELQMELETNLGGNSKKRKRKGKRDAYLSEESLKTFGQANNAYVAQNYVEAIKHIHEVIREAPGFVPAWKLMGEIYEELKDVKKSMSCFMVAAHLQPKEIQLWKRLGEQSRKEEQLEQAIYCYSRAIRLDRSDLDAIWDRSFLYSETGEYQKAITGFNTILEHAPHNMHIITELSKIYLTINEPEKGIELLESVIRADENHEIVGDIDEEDDVDEEMLKRKRLDTSGSFQNSNEKPGRDTVHIGFTELSILGQLYMAKHQWENAIFAIDKGLRRLCNLYNLEKEPDQDWRGIHLPLDLRSKLCISRLWMGQESVAKEHFQYMIANPENVKLHTDIFCNVTDAYIQKRMFTAALEVLSIITGDESTTDTGILRRMGQCYKELGDYQTACEMYIDALEFDPEDISLKSSLADIYEAMGQEEQAAILMKEVAEHTAAQKAENPVKVRSSRKRRDVTAEDGTVKRRGPSDRKGMNYATLRESEIEMETECRSLYDKMNEFLHSTQRRKESIQAARKLLSHFESNSAFYTISRSKTLSNILPLEADHSSEKDITQNVAKFKGLTIDEWYEVFIKSAIGLCLDGNPETALSVLTSASDANVFFHDEKKKMKLKLYQLSIAIRSENFPMISEICRWFCNYRPFKNSVYSLYSSSLTGSPDAVAYFASKNTQKYIIRQIKAMETVAQTKDSEKGKGTTIWAVYGHILSCAGRHTGAMNAYMHAYRLCPESPLINFSLGRALITRAMQRSSSNRHLQIVQGFSLLFQYYKLKGKSQDAMYNLGRAFHQIGLCHLATYFYRKVLEYDDLKLEDKTFSLKREAAYNLSLIFVSSGSMELAARIIREYCTI